MLARRITRLSEMDLAELGWRSRTFARNAVDRVIAARAPSRWMRSRLAPSLAPRRELAAVHAALTRRRWQDAHRGLARHFRSSVSRFPIAESRRASLVATIAERVPSSATAAVGRADRILAGEYDLLGYRGLHFGGDAREVDWHLDPVHDRRSPPRFWAAVQYLDPSCGDHKIIWELNRHQHWCTLGRAFWLTGEPKYRDRCLAELRSWLDANPPLVGINWASMLELGLRSISWLWALHFFVATADEDDTPWLVDFLLALDRQLSHVERHLSYYFSPNTHLLGEALALYVTGRVLPELAGSERRQALGRRVLVQEIARQILPDGGHCERSTHYHRYALDFYILALAIARTTDDPIAPSWEEAVGRLAGAARLLADDRGRLPRIGDDDGGSLLEMTGRPTDDIRDTLAMAAALTGRSDLRIGPIPEEAFWMLGHPRLRPSLARLLSPDASQVATGIASAALAHTGYFVSRSSRGDQLTVDGGAHGYRNGGHAHADALSLTLTVRGTPLLIDAGTGCYTVDPDLRDRLRSTAMHNTLTLDGRPQSIPAGPFAWSTRADGRVHRWITGEAFDYFEGSHDGYGPLEHRRHILVLRGDLVVVADLVHGRASASQACVHWHVDPRWQVVVRDRVVTLSADGEQCQLAIPVGQIETFEGDAGTGLGWHAPAYGVVEPAVTIRVTLEQQAPFWIVGAFGLQAANPIVSARVASVWPASGRLARRMAVQIVRRTSTESFELADPGGADWPVAGTGHSATAVVLRRSTRDGAVTDLAAVGADQPDRWETASCAG